ncbi:uncharacterized protein LOC110496718 [Oncorhynchus mykiss]|uniref:uncharacterized protein LOC110496718 n=1 Tax=Oncorhynchus mykiss TaxID=8022 RepID=UPI001877D597|nr:uncharacterized protein LOC110496718 [Oncorhynchus mykiss]
MRLRGCPSHNKFARLLSANIEMRIASSLGSLFKENGGQFQTGSSTCMLQKRLASHVLPCVKKRWRTPTESGMEDGYILLQGSNPLDIWSSCLMAIYLAVLLPLWQCECLTGFAMLRCRDNR